MPIFYGYPSFEMFEESDLGKVELGGCCMETDVPDRHCKACEHQWHKTDNYKRD